MAPDWLYELILKKPEPKPEATADRPSDFFRSVNSAALADLPAWVPSLFPGAKYQPGTKAFRVSSCMLGRDLEEDLSIAPNGIVDFGIHDMGDARQGKRTAIDLVIEYGGASDACAAAFWLCERMRRSRASFGWNEDNGRGEEPAAQLLAGAADEHEDEPPPPPPPPPISTGISGYGDDWTRPEGLLAEIADWIMLTSRRPNRPWPSPLLSRCCRPSAAGISTAHRHRPKRLYRLPRRHRRGQGPATVCARSNPRRSQP